MSKVKNPSSTSDISLSTSQLKVKNHSSVSDISLSTGQLKAGQSKDGRRVQQVKQRQPPPEIVLSKKNWKNSEPKLFLKTQLTHRPLSRWFWEYEGPCHLNGSVVQGSKSQSHCQQNKVHCEALAASFLIFYFRSLGKGLHFIQT